MQIDADLTVKNTDKDLRRWYRKWNAYQEAWAKIQKLRGSGQWEFNVGKTELINLFGKRSMWTSYVTPAMKDIHDYRIMVEWLERNEDEDEPSDLAVWGIAKQSYNFKDLDIWKRKGNLKMEDQEKRMMDKAKTKTKESARKEKSQRNDSGDQEMRKEEKKSKSKSKVLLRG